jgi:hypothetical protein
LAFDKLLSISAVVCALGLPLLLGFGRGLLPLMLGNSFGFGGHYGTHFFWFVQQPA